MPRPLTPLTSGLLALLLFHAVGVTAGLHLVAGTPRVGTLAHQVDLFAARTQSNDSWRPMSAARQYANQHGGAGIYEEIFFKRRIKFQYPPTSLLFLGNLSRPALKWISWCSVWVTALVCVHVFTTQAASSAETRTAGGLDWLARTAVLLGLALTFYPVLRAYGLGQIQAWVNALFALLVLAWTRGRYAASGVMLGLMCLIKPTYAVIGLWALLRHQWRFLLGAIGTGAAGLAVSVAAFGVTAHVEYLRVLSYVGSRGEAYFPNQSFNGLMNRLVGNGSNLVWQEDAFPPFHPLVYGVTLAAGLILLALALRPIGRPRSNSLLDLVIISVTATVMSPLAWEHHFGTLLPLYAAATPILIAGASTGRATPLILAVCFVLTGQYFEFVQRFAATPLNILQSYVLAGALGLLAVAHLAVRRPSPDHS